MASPDRLGGDEPFMAGKTLELRFSPSRSSRDSLESIDSSKPFDDCNEKPTGEEIAEGLTVLKRKRSDPAEDDDDLTEDEYEHRLKLTRTHRMKTAAAPEVIDLTEDE